MMLKTMPSPSQPVSFRLAAEAHRRLSMKAAGQGVPIGEFVRDLVLDKLDEGEKTQATLEDLREDVGHLKSLLATSVECLLRAHVAKRPPTHEEIKMWVDSRLRKPRHLSSQESDSPEH